MTPRLLFANLCADVARCVKAAQQGDEAHYQDSLRRGYKTAQVVHNTGDMSAFEESLLLLRGLEHARIHGGLDVFLAHTDKMAAQCAPAW